jgi:hypothetical protein
MLLANLTKSDAMKKLLTLSRAPPRAPAPAPPPPPSMVELVLFSIPVARGRLRGGAEEYTV